MKREVWAVVLIAVVFACVQLAGAFDLKVKEIKQLTFEGYNTEPAWSPDGKTIAFFVEPETENEVYGIYLMNSDGSNIRLLRRLDYSVYACCIAWSPDGKKMAFLNDSKLYLMDADGSNLTLINVSVIEDAFGYKYPASGLVGSHTSWSKDGTKILYQDSRGLRECIAVINLSASVSKQLVTCDEGHSGLVPCLSGMAYESGGTLCCPNNMVQEPGTERCSTPSYFYPIWLDNDSTILFLRFDRKLFLMNSNGGSERLWRNLSGWIASPRLSPDGKYLAYTNNSEIEVMDVESGGTALLTNSGYYFVETTPSWSPDGKKVVFGNSSVKNQTSQIYVAELDIGGTTLPVPLEMLLTPTPKPAGFELLFALSSLLALAYLIRRRA